MKKGYLAREAMRAEMHQAKRLAFFWIILAGAGVILYYAARYLPALFTVFSIVFSAGFVVVFFPTVYFIYRILKQLIKPGYYTNLIVYAEGMSKKEAGLSIDAEAAQGEILVEEYLYYLIGNRLKRKKGKVVLLPSFLLISDENSDFTAIPTDKIYWICIQIAARGGYPVSKLKIFYDRKIQEIDNLEFLHTFYIVNRIQQYIPDVFYAYNPFIFSFELEGIFYRNYNEFKEIYNQHKEALLENSRDNEDDSDEEDEDREN